MKPALSKRRILTELAWLLGSWVSSWVATSKILGQYTGIVDIQLHNTYFVVPVLALATILALIIATIATGARVLAGRGRNVAASVVLLVLSGTWLLLILTVFVVRALR